MKAKFQHIYGTKVSGFKINLYVDIDDKELLFSLDGFWYRRGHFQVFSAVSMDTRNAVKLTKRLSLQ